MSMDGFKCKQSDLVTEEENSVQGGVRDGATEAITFKENRFGWSSNSGGKQNHVGASACFRGLPLDRPSQVKLHH